MKKLTGSQKWRLAGLCVISVILLAMAVRIQTWMNARQMNDLLTCRAEPASFSVQVDTIGVLDTSRSHMVASSLRGEEAKIIYLIEDGAHVSKGDLLIRFDNTPYAEKTRRLEGDVRTLTAAVRAKEQVLAWERNQVEKSLNTAAYNMKVAVLELRKLKEGDGPLQIATLTEAVNGAAGDLEKYRVYLAKLIQLQERGYENLAEVAQARKKIAEFTEKLATAEKKKQSYENHVFPTLVEAANARVERADMEQVALKTGGTFKIAKAMSDLEESRQRLITAQTALAEAEAELSQTELYAPFAGIVILYETYRDGEKRKPRVGDRAIRNQPILYLPDVTAMVVKTQIREIDLKKVSLGMPATVRVDAYPDQMFKGTVGFVGALATDRPMNGLGGKYFQLSVMLPDAGDDLRPGMTARVTLHAGEISAARALPVEAVFVSGGRTVVFRQTDQGWESVAVQTGADNGDWVEILSGISLGDVISRVRPEKRLH
ncbi:MAG: hypothetical protein CSA22_02485 [Deltaproteobacteria bacterium]|nr:MAG: hypothetical protein CSA22_02485 [Deltaproteobacteria bacterium]